MKYNNNDECDSFSCKKDKKESMFEMPSFDMGFDAPQFGFDKPSKGKSSMGLATDDDIDQLSALGKRLMGE